MVLGGVKNELISSVAIHIAYANVILLMQTDLWLLALLLSLAGLEQDQQLFYEVNRVGLPFH